MNRITGTSAAMFVMFAFAAGSPVLLTGCTDDKPATANVEDENLTTLTFSVTGMHCQGCVSSVRNAIAKIDGVRSCEVSLEDESALVKASDPLVAQSIVDAVAALDFTIEPTN